MYQQHANTTRCHALDFFENRRILCYTHAEQLVGPITFVQSIVGMLLEFFHMCTNEHLAKFYAVRESGINSLLQAN